MSILKTTRPILKQLAKIIDGNGMTAKKRMFLLEYYIIKKPY